ncbi:MAG: FAD-binding oxidoreductase [Opitutales bacterium]|nr:FAD-binding oxidoreductase [Opitutales bacterium]NRA28488.1 FAD-binding oxidoreductase [Opitutales bacterium]
MLTDQAKAVPVPDSIIEEFESACGAINVKRDARTLEKLSKDYYWYSPILKPRLESLKADFAIKVDSLEMLTAAVKLAFKHRLPISIRGGGTGNYGQMIPLYGGVLLDLSRMDKIHSVEGGVVRCEPGAKLSKIEKVSRAAGYELRCMPSTWIKSSMGGFLCGGSGGIGSIQYGGIAHGDNMKSATILTVEAEPRLRKFEETDCLKALHTYGTTGILVEAEMRLGEKKDYQQIIAVGDSWKQASEFCDAVARDKTLVKRLVTGFEPEVPDYFTPIKEHLPKNCSASFFLIEVSQAEELKARAEAVGMKITFDQPLSDPPAPPYITDYTWNHTTLHALTVDPTITYLQVGFGDNWREQVAQLKEKFGQEFLLHCEWVLSNPKMQVDAEIVVGGLPIIRYRDPEQLQGMIDYCWEIGVFVANPHTDKLEEGGAHPDIEEKRALKAESDPQGILNPGKMITYPDNPFAA